MSSRREVLSWMGLGSLAGITGAVTPHVTAQAAVDAAPTRHSRAHEESARSPASAVNGYAFTPTRPLNGWTLPFVLRDGVKEFHLVAEEVEHEFAPGSTAKCWGYNAMGKNGMAKHGAHIAMGMLEGPANTLPMMGGEGPFGPLEMGGMFTVVKVRDDLAAGDHRDPGWYANPPGTVAARVSRDPDFGEPVRKPAS